MRQALLTSLTIALLAVPAAAQEVPHLVAKLSDRAWANREAATKALVALGPTAIPAVESARQAAERDGCLEAVRRLDHVRLQLRLTRAAAGADGLACCMLVDPTTLRPGEAVSVAIHVKNRAKTGLAVGRMWGVPTLRVRASGKEHRFACISSPIRWAGQQLKSQQREASVFCLPWGRSHTMRYDVRLEKAPKGLRLVISDWTSYGEEQRWIADVPAGEVQLVYRYTRRGSRIPSSTRRGWSGTVTARTTLRLSK